MSMTVEIKIGGDVIIYDKDGDWNFVFITDEEHEAEYSMGGLSGRLRGPNSDRVLVLRPTDGEPNPTRSWGSNGDKIFNMDRLHGNSGTKSTLTVMHASPPYREVVHLKVSRGTVDAISWYSNYLYASYPDGTEQTYGPAAKLVRLTFEVKEVPGKPALQLIDEGSGHLIQSWPFKAGKLEGVIDNDCKGSGSAIDFLHFYDWVREAGIRRFFVARKDPSATVVTGGKEGAIEHLANSKIFGPDGNCDPVRIFPPPLP